MALLSNPGFVAMLSGVEKTSSGQSYYWIDGPSAFRLVKEGDTFTLGVDHNQSSVTSINWEEAANTEFTVGYKELAFTDATCDTHSNTTVNCDSTAKMVVGQVVTGSGIPTDTTITVVDNATTFTISQAATTSLTNTTLTFTYSDVSGGLTLTLTVGPVKDSRFPRPRTNLWGERVDFNRYYRCKVVHSGTTYYSPIVEVMVDWPDPPGVGRTQGTQTGEEETP